MGIELAHIPLDELLPALVNPKDHDNATTADSMDEFGFLQPMIRDDRTGRLLAGHGRFETLVALRERGEPPPENVDVDEQGRWVVPVNIGIASKDDAEAHAMALSLNRVGEGLWKNEPLAGLLLSLEEERGLVGTGFDSADLERLLNELAMAQNEPPLPGREARPADDLPFTFGEYQGRVSVEVFESFKSVYEGKREKGEMLDSVLRRWLGIE